MLEARRDPMTGLYCRSDGAVLMPPSRGRFKAFRWTVGAANSHGYKKVRFQGKFHSVHQIVCRAFHGLAPEDKPFVDHINRVRDDNRPSNLHWASCKENNDNADRVDQSIKKFKVRACEDRAAYMRARYAAHCEERRVI